MQLQEVAFYKNKTSLKKREAGKCVISSKQTKIRFGVCKT